MEVSKFGYPEKHEKNTENQKFGLPCGSRVGNSR